MKEDEREFLLAVYRMPQHKSVCDVIKETGIHDRRALALLYKWLRCKWYDYARTIDTGWLTQEGKEIAREQQWLETVHLGG